MLQIVRGHVAKLSNYPRLRVLLIIIAIIIVFIVVINLIKPSNVKKNQTAPSQVQSVNTGGKQTPAPSNQNAEYQQLNNAYQSAADQKSIQSGGSVFQNAINPNQNPLGQNSFPPQNGSLSEISSNTPTSNSGQSGSSGQLISGNKNMNDNDVNAANANNNTALTQQISTLQQQLSAQQASNEASTKANAEQAAQTQLQSIKASMQSSLQNISNDWKIPTLATVQSAASTGANANSATSAPQLPVAIKAGTILFGVVNTALNSDTPGTPVLATIVSGPYKGAKLLGGFTATDTALVVQFNLMTLPKLSSSVGINAYAIDGKTANNAIASNVDNHYLLRYGMLFAGAFLQGFGNAYQNTVYCPPGVQNCTIWNTGGASGNGVPDAPATVKTATYQGLGQVGATLGQTAANRFNTPPTVTVNQGTGIGILFMSDIRLPLN